jgi:hypothetical protein
MPSDSSLEPDARMIPSWDPHLATLEVGLPWRTPTFLLSRRPHRSVKSSITSFILLTQSAIVLSPSYLPLCRHWNLSHCHTRRKECLACLDKAHRIGARVGQSVSGLVKPEFGSRQ